MNKYNIPLFETHAHYDHIRFHNKGPQIVENLREFGLQYVVLPAITLESNANARMMFNRTDYPEVFYAIGLHPKIASNSEKSTDNTILTLKSIRDSKTVAAKTGLDYSVKQLSTTQRKRQKDYFEALIDFSEEYHLPLVLHIREAFDDAVSILKNRDLPYNGTVVHCFNSSYGTFKKCDEVGVTYFGIGGAITYDINSDLQDCVRKMPLDRIVLETDAPFQKPSGRGPGPNTSLALITIAEKIAELKGIGPEDVLWHAYENASTLYRL